MEIQELALTFTRMAVDMAIAELDGEMEISRINAKINQVVESYEYALSRVQSLKP